MTENKRYVVMVDTDLEVSLKDNITKKYPFSLICENIDEFEPLLDEVTNVCAELNKNWEQTLRFEKYNQELVHWNIKYEDIIDELKHENKELDTRLTKYKEKIQLLQGELNADAKQYQIFIDIIDEADDLIMSHLSKHYQRKWRTFCKNKEYDFE